MPLVHDLPTVITAAAAPGQTVFSFPFKAYAISDLSVTVDGVAATYAVAPANASQYSIAMNVDEGGTITFGAGLTSGQEVVIESVIAIERVTQFPNSGPVPMSDVNLEFNRHIRMMQDIRTKAERGLLVPVGESGIVMPSSDLRANKFLYFDSNGTPIFSDGVGVYDGLREQLALRGVGQGADLVGVRDGAAPAGSLYTTLQGFMDKLRVATGGGGGGIIPYGSDQVYPSGTLGNEMTPRVTLAGLANVPPQTGKLVFVHDDYKEGFFRWKSGDYTAQVAADPYQGIYRASGVAGYGVTVGCWVRLWDEQNAKPEWFGVVPNSSGAAATNDVRIAACYALVPHTRFGPFDYWTTTTIKANLNHHKISGCGEKYNDQFGAMTRIVCTSGSVDILRIGPDTNPGSINAMPQGILVQDIMLGRSVAPVISSNCRGVYMVWVLNAIARNVKTDGCMVGFEESATVHCFKINCEAVRANAGTGGGTDYFVGHYANGATSGIGLAGGNASLYNVDCTAGCNYGPLQSATGSVGFKADQGFTDVWYWNPETTNFYIAQGVYGNDNAGLVYSNTDFGIFHPIHDQFKYIGIYVTDVAASGSVEIENPYYGPTNGARAAYWVNSSEGAVASRGGQWVMGGAPLTQPVLFTTGRGSDLLGFPVILEAGNTYPVVGLGDMSDCRIEVFAKNPTVSAGALVQLAGTCVANVIIPKASGKAAAFQYGIQVVGTGDARCEYQVSGLNSACLQAATRKLDRNGVAVTAVGLTGTNYAFGVFT